MKDFIASEKFLIGSNGQVGGIAPNAVNDIIKWDGNKWVAGVNPGGNGGGGSAVAEPFTTSLNSGSTTYSVVFPEPFDIAPSIATDLEITGDGPIIPYTISNLTTNGYDVIFAKEIPNNNYKIHTVFGGGGGGTGGGDSTLSGESLQEIDRQIVSNAVDVFVYDTQQDSDGGAWRSRTSHTSWYNEPLNTATRGGRREFPAVAVIVAESDKVTIYDGDDPDLSMWMVFNASGGRMIWATQLSCVSSLNARLSIGSPASGFRYIDFISDKMREWRTSGVNSISGNISERNDGDLTLIDVPGQDVIVNQIINDVAMTVLPNAPIDSDTGLPVPTIAVATDGGVSVIKDDGSVVDLLSPYEGYENVTKISFSSDGRLHFNMYDENRPGRYFMLTDIPDKDETLQMSFEPDGDSFNKLYILDPGAHSYTTTITKALNDNFAEKIQVLSDSRNVFGSSGGLNFLDYNKNIMPSINESAEGMVCYATSSYNTGWMPGDIKLATLSDTKAEVIGDLGEELITNGTFDTDVSGWTLIDPTANPDATITWNNGVAEIFRPNGQGARFYQAFNTIIGREYVVSAGVNVGGYYIADDIDPSSWNIIANDGAVILDTSEHRFFATSNVTYFILNSNAVNASHPFDNISAKQTGELVTNGTFDNGTVGWTENNGASLSVNASKQLIITNGNYGFAQQNLSGLTIGKKYVFSYDVIVGTSSEARAYVRKGDGATEYLSKNYTSDASGSITFIATQTDHPVRLLTYSDTSGETSIWDNVSVRLAEDDRSVNDNGLQIFGEIDKTPVAPGADLVAYSGFSADDYLMQPYNPDLDFGTGDFCIMGWFKNANASGNLLSRILPQVAGTIGTDRGFMVGFTNSNKLRFSIYTQGFNSEQGRAFLDSDDNQTEINTWTHFVVTRDGGQIKFYFNGKKQASETANSDDISDNTISIPLSIGCFNEVSGYEFTGSTALIRVSATAPTLEQIAKIYRDEKFLFQDGAQATLHGTSDAVTALAYDDSDDLLHVGTASGRSTFNGLKRVDNTTTAVTTAISANEGLVIEQ